jgi:hypothetical protein
MRPRSDRRVPGACTPNAMRAEIPLPCRCPGRMRYLLPEPCQTSLPALANCSSSRPKPVTKITHSTRQLVKATLDSVYATMPCRPCPVKIPPRRSRPAQTNPTAPANPPGSALFCLATGTAAPGGQQTGASPSTPIPADRLPALRFLVPGPTRPDVRPWTQHRAVPRAHRGPLSGLGARLCPNRIATGTPQAFPVVSWYGFYILLRSSRRSYPRQRCAAPGSSPRTPASSGVSSTCPLTYSMT